MVRIARRRRRTGFASETLSARRAGSRCAHRRCSRRRTATEPVPVVCPPSATTTSPCTTTCRSSRGRPGCGSGVGTATSCQVRPPSVVVASLAPLAATAQPRSGVSKSSAPVMPASRRTTDHVSPPSSVAYRSRVGETLRAGRAPNRDRRRRSRALRSSRRASARTGSPSRRRPTGSGGSRTRPSLSEPRANQRFPPGAAAHNGCCGVTSIGWNGPAGSGTLVVPATSKTVVV